MPQSKCDTIAVMNIIRPGKCRKKRYQRAIHPASGAAATDSLFKISDIPRTYIFDPEEDDEVDDEEYEDVEQEAGFELEMESEFFEDY